MRYEGPAGAVALGVAGIMAAAAIGVVADTITGDSVGCRRSRSRRRHLAPATRRSPACDPPVASSAPAPRGQDAVVSQPRGERRAAARNATTTPGAADSTTTTYDDGDSDSALSGRGRGRAARATTAAAGRTRLRRRLRRRVRRLARARLGHGVGISRARRLGVARRADRHVVGARHPVRRPRAGDGFHAGSMQDQPAALVRPRDRPAAHGKVALRSRPLKTDHPHDLAGARVDADHGIDVDNSRQDRAPGRTADGAAEGIGVARNSLPTQGSVRSRPRPRPGPGASDRPGVAHDPEAALPERELAGGPVRRRDRVARGARRGLDREDLALVGKHHPYAPVAGGDRISVP